LSHIFAICDFTNPAKDRRKLLFEHAIATIISNGANSTQGWRKGKKPRSRRLKGKQGHYDRGAGWELDRR
jgi:hypothetical protein